MNARARINVPFGASLTTVAELPPGAQRDLTDPYAESPSPWPKIVALAVILWILYVVLNRQGCIHDWTGGAFGNARATSAQPAAAAPE